MFKMFGCEAEYSIQETHVQIQWLTLRRTVIKLLVLLMAGNFLARWATISYYYF
jgi:hypothetical protein